MCRLFGSQSLGPTAVQHLLLDATNSLRIQSHRHPHGWGVGGWAGGKAFSERGAGAAFAEAAFESAVRRIQSPTVIAHVRKASVGRVSRANAHPFQWGAWLFAHNGTVSSFRRSRRRIEAEVAEAYRPIVVGETDSVRCFALFLTRLARLCDPAGTVPIEAIARALGETVSTVAGITDHLAAKPSSTTFLVSNGASMLACRRGRSLFYATRTGAEDEVDVPGARVPRLVIASERLTNVYRWSEVPADGMVGVDEALRLHRFDLAGGTPTAEGTSAA